MELERVVSRDILEWGESVKDWLYVMFIDKGKNYKKVNKEMVVKHVGHIRALDESGKLALCGAFKGYPGVAGMVVLRAESQEEAEELCNAEPLVAEGFATYRLVALHAGNRENNYLL